MVVQIKREVSTSSEKSLKEEVGGLLWLKLVVLLLGSEILPREE